MVCNKCGSPVKHNALFCHHCGQAVRVKGHMPQDTNYLLGVIGACIGAVIGSFVSFYILWSTSSYYYCGIGGALLGILVPGGFWLLNKQLDRTGLVIAGAVILLSGFLANWFGWGAAIWGPGTDTNFGILPAGMLLLFAFLQGGIDLLSFSMSLLEIYMSALLCGIVIALLAKKFAKRPLPKI